MLTLFFGLLNVLCVGWAEAPNPPTHMDYRIDGTFQYFDSSANYTSGGGSSADLYNSGYFNDMIFTGLYTQDLDREKRVYGGFNYSMTESYDGTNTRSNSGFNEILAGGQYWTNLFGYPTAPAADFVYPLYRVDKNGDDALLGEGAIKLRLGGWMMLGNPVWDPFVFLGYEYRDEGRSHAIPYTFGVKWKSRPFWAQLEYRGYERLFSNSDTENRNQRDLFLQRVNGGSYRYYAINSALSEAALEAGYSFGTIGVYGGAAMTINGASAAQGYTLLAGLAYTPGADTGAKEEGSGSNFDPVDMPADRFTPHVDPFDDLDPTKPPKKRKARPAAPATPAGPPPPPPDMPTDMNQAPRVQPQKGGAMPNVQMVPAPKKSAPAKRAAPAPKPPPPKPKPKPVKKNKVDKMLDEAEENLKNL
jgi:hypothetical protein